jgi:hypothetical protein
MTEKSLDAIIRTWASDTGFFASEFNLTSLRNRLRYDVDSGVAFSYEMLNANAEWLRRNNFLEQPPSTVRRRGEIVSSSIPKLFEYVSDEEQAQIDTDQAAKAAAERKREDAENRNLSLDELRKKARAARGVINGETIRVYQG